MINTSVMREKIQAEAQNCKALGEKNSMKSFDNKFLEMMQDMADVQQHLVYNEEDSQIPRNEDGVILVSKFIKTQRCIVDGSVVRGLGLKYHKIVGTGNYISQDLLIIPLESLLVNDVARGYLINRAELERRFSLYLDEFTLSETAFHQGKIYMNKYYMIPVGGYMATMSHLTSNHWVFEEMGRAI